MRALHPLQLVSPAITSMRPSGSEVTVGYQRATDMEGPELQPWLAGSKMVALGMPTWAEEWPPATNTRPSGSSAWAGQKRSAVYNGTAVRLFVAGAKTSAGGLSV